MLFSSFFIIGGVFVMKINRVYVDQNEVLGNQVFVSGLEEVPKTNYRDQYIVCQLDSRKEPSAFVICENSSKVDKFKGFAEVESMEGFSISTRQFTHAGKSYHEPVFIVDSLKVKK